MMDSNLITKHRYPEPGFAGTNAAIEVGSPTRRRSAHLHHDLVILLKSSTPPLCEPTALIIISRTENVGYRACVRARVPFGAVKLIRQRSPAHPVPEQRHTRTGTGLKCPCRRSLPLRFRHP